MQDFDGRIWCCWYSLKNSWRIARGEARLPLLEIRGSGVRKLLWYSLEFGVLSQGEFKPGLDLLVLLHQGKRTVKKGMRSNLFAF
jgi:hypothetical protein